MVTTTDELLSRIDKIEKILNDILNEISNDKEHEYNQRSL